MDLDPHIVFCPNCRTGLEVLPSMAESQAKCSACMSRFGLDGQLHSVPADPANDSMGGLQMVRLLYPPSDELAPSLSSEAKRLPDSPRPRLHIIEMDDEEIPPVRAIGQRRERIFWEVLACVLLLIVLVVLGWRLWLRYGSTGPAGSARPPPTLPATVISPVPEARPTAGSGGRQAPAVNPTGSTARP